MKKVYIVGIGMGNPETVTVQGRRVIEESPALIGAKRMVESFPEAGGVRGYGILAGDIFAWIKARPEEQIAVLMSGDVGFYSGAKKLADLILEHNSKLADGAAGAGERMELQLIPGVSSLQYFCARLLTSWDDVRVVSLHGREANICGPVQTSRKTFFLTGSDHKAEDICRALEDCGLGGARVSVGENLSYGTERITTGTAAELSRLHFDSLAVALVENQAVIDAPRIAHGMEDDSFARGNVPMTKQEIRSVTLSKLNPGRADILYDIGAGTGSVSVELALLAREGQVYAVETNREAVELIEENKGAFGLCNLHIVEGRAPEALAELPPPDKAFIGGTKGNMEEILRVLFEKNPRVRVAINVIALESLQEAMAGLAAMGCRPEAVQVSAARSREVGRYHMMTAQNPVFIVTGQRKDNVENSADAEGI